MAVHLGPIIKGIHPKIISNEKVTLQAWYCLQWVVFIMLTNGNDPSIGSPTETLLRLLLPLNDQVWSTFWHPSHQ